MSCFGLNLLNLVSRISGKCRDFLLGVLYDFYKSNLITRFTLKRQSHPPWCHLGALTAGPSCLH